MTLTSTYWEESYPPSVFTPPAPPPDKGSASPGDVFPSEPTVTAEDQTNADKLTALGYVAAPLTLWTAGQYITVGTFHFRWNGAAWAPGMTLATQTEPGTEEEPEPPYEPEGEPETEGTQEEPPSEQPS